MRRDQQIKKAVKLLGGRGSDEVEYVLEAIETVVNRHQNEKDRQSKKTRRALDRYLSALRRAQAAHDALPEELQTIVFPRPLPLLSEDKLKHYKKLLATKVKPLRDAARAEAAVKEARFLLRHFGLPVVTTRDKLWHRLSAVLYGNERADLFRHLRKTRSGS